MTAKKPKNPTLKPTGTTLAFPQSNHPLALCVPLDDRVVIRRDDAKQTTPGGIILTQQTTGASKTQLATVISVGPGAWKPDGSGRVPMNLVPGDRVIVAPYAALEIIDPSAGSAPEEYAILRREDILATIPKQPAA